MTNGGFSAGKFGVQEMQLSPVEQVQTPVVDESGAIKASGIASGVSAFAQTAGRAFDIYSGIKEGQRQKSLLEQQDKFKTSLLKAAQLADAHGPNSLMFKTYLTQEYANSGLDFDTKTKMLKDFQSTVLGKTFLEEDPVEEAEKALDSAATKSGFLTSDMDESQKQVGRSQYRAFLSKQEADAEELRLLQLAKTKVDLDSAQLALIDKQIKNKSYESMASLAANYRPVIKNRVVSIVKSYQDGKITRQEAEAALKSQRGDLSAVVGQLSRGLGKGDVEPLAQPMYDLYDGALSNLDSTNILKELENSMKIMEAKTQQNLLLNDPELVNAVAFSSLTKHSDATTIATIGNIGARILKGNSKKGTDTPANLLDGEVDSKSYLDLVSNGIGNLTRLTPTGEPMVDSKELNVHVENILKGTAKFMSDMDRPAKIKTVVQWLADPKVGEYVKGNLSSLSAAARLNIGDTLVQNAKNYVYPKVADIISSEFMQGGKRQVQHSDVDVSLSSGQVVFRATNRDPWTMSVAQKMNREVGAAMSSYFNAIANVSGEPVDEIFNRELGTFWPEKAKTEPDSDKSAKPTIDPTQYEGQAIEDEEGSIFIVRNGSYVKVRGAGDAKQ